MKPHLFIHGLITKLYPTMTLSSKQVGCETTYFNPWLNQVFVHIMCTLSCMPQYKQEANTRNHIFQSMACKSRSHLTMTCTSCACKREASIGNHIFQSMFCNPDLSHPHSLMHAISKHWKPPWLAKC